jgi:hypothetical protein
MGCFFIGRKTSEFVVIRKGNYVFETLKVCYRSLLCLSVSHRNSQYHTQRQRTSHWRLYHLFDSGLNYLISNE